MSLSFFALTASTTPHLFSLWFFAFLFPFNAAEKAEEEEPKLIKPKPLRSNMGFGFLTADALQGKLKKRTPPVLLSYLILCIHS
jgi:hypothetical protein